MPHNGSSLNAELQADEVTALASIFGDEMSPFDASTASFSISVAAAASSNSSLLLRVTLPPHYPTEGPPVFELTAPWLRGEARRRLEAVLIDVGREASAAGAPVVYAWVEAARQFLEETAAQASEEAAAVVNQDAPDEQSANTDTDTATATAAAASLAADAFVHGEPIEDRRSVFQAHLLAPVESAAAAKLAVAALLASERKIAAATHNIWAYRICRPPPAASGFITDCEDDGEAQAGGRLLRLLELTGARNVLVVVSRWYGGVLLGPDRFRHISNAARRLLDAAGLVEPARRAAGSKGSKE